MKKKIFIIPLIFLIYCYATAAESGIGTVDSISNAKKEITVKIFSGKSVKMGDVLEVSSGDGKIQLNVKYPMMTIAICKIQGKGNISSINKGMNVYLYGKSPDNKILPSDEAADERLTDNRAGIIRDNSTGLMWLKDADPARKNMTWEESLDFIDNLNAAGYTDWRLPSKEEFEYFLKLGREEIKKNFDNVRYFYWTSSEYAGSSAYIWVADIDDGTTNYNFKTNENYILAVRDGKGSVKRKVRLSNEDDPIKDYAENICKKHNEEYISYKTEVDAFSISIYDVICRKGKKESEYKLKYNKLLGTWED